MELSCLVTRPGLSARDRFGRRWPCGLAQGTRSCERAAGRGVRAERLPANYRQHRKGREGRLLHVTWYESPPRKQTAQRNPQTAGASALPRAPAGSGGRAHTLRSLSLFVCLFVFCFRATMAFERCIRKEMQLRQPKSAMLLAEKFRI